MAYHGTDIPKTGNIPGSTNGFEIKRNPSGTFILTIWGRFPPNWAGNLSTGFSQNRINIIRGNARKTKTSWSAKFEIMPARFATDPRGIDYIALALNGTDTELPPRISIDEFTLVKPESNNGALLLEIKAADQLGFLGNILNRMAFYSLFPEEMIIETEDGRISDRFWVKGVGGLTPSESSINTLKQKLDSIVTCKNVD